MATDEVLLGAALAGVATLRFYDWSPATLSLGYFQSEKLRRADPLLAALPFVRRPSGGEMLVHHYEVTYALALPPGAWQMGRKWALRMHEIIVAALAKLGIAACGLASPTTSGWSGSADSQRLKGPLCFQHLTAGDVEVGGAKVVGSAQRKHHGAVLQHGGILLAQSPHTPTLPGIQELTGRELTAAQVVEAMLEVFAEASDACLVEQPLSGRDQEKLDDLKNNKYASIAWNCKR